MFTNLFKGVVYQPLSAAQGLDALDLLRPTWYLWKQGVKQIRLPENLPLSIAILNARLLSKL